MMNNIENNFSAPPPPPQPEINPNIENQPSNTVPDNSFDLESSENFSEQPEKNQEKEQKLDEIRQDVENTGDRLGKPIDGGIKETVVMFKANELPTSGSCEGHVESGLPVPYVDVSAPNEPAERFVGENEIFEKVANKYNVTPEEVRTSQIDEAYWEAMKESSQNEETEEYKKWNEENEKLIQKGHNLLDEFYKERQVEPNVKLEIEEGVGGFRIHNGGEDYNPSIEEKGEFTEQEKKIRTEKVEKYRSEMNEFTEFLKGKYFENNEKSRTEQIEQEKIANDPTRNFLKEQGFEGDPKIKYSIDVISAESEKGVRLLAQKTFSNYDDLQSFIQENPDAIARKEIVEKLGIVPFKIDYDQSVYEWSSKLNKEQDQKLSEAFDRFADEKMDIKNFEKAREKMTPDEIKKKIGGLENKTLTHLDNPELSQIIGDKDEIARVVRRMGMDARQFENPDQKTLAGMAEQDLMQLGDHLKNGTSEDLLKADQLLGNYLYRSLSNQLREIFNRADVSIPWEEKEKMLKISSLADKIRGREDILKTRDLMAQEQSLRRIIGKYETENLPEDQEKVKNKEQEFEAIIPRGWTTLKHGTNALNWGEINPYSSDRIKLEKPLSMISQEEFEQDKQAGGQYDTTKNYAEVARRPEGMPDDEYAEKNKPFEMRVVFYKDHARHHTDPEYSQGLDKKTMDQIAKYYFANIQGGRHPLVPKGETLVKIGQTQEGGKDVFYFVPESLAETYSSEAGVEIKESKKESAKGLNTEEQKKLREQLKSEIKPKEELPQDSRSLNRYFIDNFRKFEGITLEQFKQQFTPETEQKFQAWAKQHIDTIIKEQPTGVRYPDTVASVLGNSPAAFQSMVLLKEGRNVGYDELLKMPFSEAAKKYLDIDLPEDYFNHFSKK